MFRMTKAPTTQTASTKTFHSHTLRSKTKQVTPPQYIDISGESVCECADEIPLHLYELKSPPSSFFQSFPNPFELPKSTETSIANQPWEGVV